jgi:general secretion pathway protein M
MTRGRGWPIVILIAVAVLVVFVGLLPAYEAFAEQSDELAQTRQDFAGYRAEIAARPRLKAALDALRRDGADNAVLLSGDSTALAAAALQGTVKALIERHGGQLRSAQTVSSRVSGNLEKVVVQDELSLPLGALKPTLYALETGTPYLFVDEIEMRPELVGDNTTAPANVQVLWTIHGYRRAEVR